MSEEKTNDNIGQSESKSVCVNCKMREAKPYFCTHCQWEMSSDKGFLKKLGDGKLWSNLENER